MQVALETQKEWSRAVIRVQCFYLSIQSLFASFATLGSCSASLLPIRLYLQHDLSSVSLLPALGGVRHGNLVDKSFVPEGCSLYNVTGLRVCLFLLLAIACSARLAPMILVPFELGHIRRERGRAGQRGDTGGAGRPAGGLLEYFLSFNYSAYEPSQLGAAVPGSTWGCLHNSRSVFEFHLGRQNFCICPAIFT